jgi:hypothetical protein
MKAYLTIVIAFLSLSGYSQTTINNYKYVVVPARYTFQKEDDQYGLNDSAKSLLRQKGFVVFISNEKLPADLVANPCKALRAELTAKNTMFTTSLTLVLRDCLNNAVFTGNEGKSREKEYIDAYSEALKKAVVSLNAASYKYDSTLSEQAQGSLSAAASAPAAAPTVSSTTSTTASTSATPATNSGDLHAQPIDNGYQLVDTTPKKVLTLLKTSLPDYFIGQAGASTGIVFKKDGIWIFEHSENNKLVSQKFEIKF